MNAQNIILLILGSAGALILIDYLYFKIRKLIKNRKNYKLKCSSPNCKKIIKKTSYFYLFENEYIYCKKCSKKKTKKILTEGKLGAKNEW